MKDKALYVPFLVGLLLGLSSFILLSNGQVKKDKSLKELADDGDIILRLSRYNNMPCLLNRLGITCDWSYLKKNQL